MTLLHKTFLSLSAIIIIFSSSIGSAANAAPLYNDKGNMIATVSRIAGNGMYGEQEGPALNSSFRQPTGLAIGEKNQLFVSDTGNHRIFKLSNGNTNTYAGPSSSLLVDTGGQPIGTLLNGNKLNAMFQSPAALAYSTDKSLYVADTANNAIRKISFTGEVTTVAGNGRIGATDGKGKEALFNHPQGIAVTKEGLIYVSDTLNHTIRKIMPDGTTTTLTAASKRVVEIHPGFVSPAGDYKNGSIQQALFNEPTGLALDEKGNLYVSDSGNQLIRYIDFSTNNVTTVAGQLHVKDNSIYDKHELYASGGYTDGSSQMAAFHTPRGIVLDKTGGLLVADSLNNVIRYIKNGNVTTVSGSQTGESGDQDGPERVALFNSPQDVAITSEGIIYVADTGNNIIKKISPYTLPTNMNKTSGINIVLEDKQIKFDTSPEIKSGRIMVPLRQIAEALRFNTTISSDGKSIHLEKGNRSIQLFLNSKKVLTSETSNTLQNKELDAAPYMKNSRTYVSLRFVAEELGIDVQWVPTAGAAILRNNITNEY
ncbi:stalk domain-containing protein [Paenibacillus sp. FSL K6-1558]|uniref:stalk domain-containing protein n=1 Tax=Paenibacillus sp. FSL K6-1558 TaxID=2921473 RepID=UPI0030FBBB4C